MITHGLESSLHCFSVFEQRENQLFIPENLLDIDKKNMDEYNYADAKKKVRKEDVKKESIEAIFFCV